MRMLVTVDSPAGPERRGCRVDERPKSADGSERRVDGTPAPGRTAYVAGASEGGDEPRKTSSAVRTTEETS
jgi:hypothetical protein